MDHHLTVCLLARSRNTCCQRNKSASWLMCDAYEFIGKTRGIRDDGFDRITSESSYDDLGVSATTCDAPVVQCSISVGADFESWARKTVLRIRDALLDVVDCSREILVDRCQRKRESHNDGRNSTSDTVAATEKPDGADERTASSVVAVSPTMGAALPIACWCGKRGSTWLDTAEDSEGFEPPRDHRDACSDASVGSSSPVLGGQGSGTDGRPCRGANWSRSCCSRAW